MGSLVLSHRQRRLEIGIIMGGLVLLCCHERKKSECHTYCYTLTWKNGSAECVESKLRINQYGFLKTEEITGCDVSSYCHVE